SGYAVRNGRSQYHVRHSLPVSERGVYLQAMKRVLVKLAIAAAWMPALVSCAGRVAPDLPHARHLVEAYVDSGRYAADCAAVARKAQDYLERRAGQVKKAAVVFDIDETSLSNWPAYRVNGWGRVTAGPCDLESGPCGLRAWQATARSKAIPSTLALA